MSRFRKPTNSDSDDDVDHSMVVRAKPIDPKLVRRLGGYGVGKDFVMGSSKSHQELAGFDYRQSVSSVSDQTNVAGEKDRLELRNKLASKILKAKMMKKMDVVERLEQKLHALDSGEKMIVDEKLLYETRRDGLQMPASSKQIEKKDPRELGAIDTAFHADRNINELIADELASSSNDQIFNAAQVAAKNRTDDDWVVDDAMLSVKRKRKNEEKEQFMRKQKLIRENRRDEQTLESCRFCFGVARFNKQCLVAVGAKAYLSTTPWHPLVKGHCLIAPIGHYTSMVALDEDVCDEFTKWKQCLVKMWQSEEMDCLFVETAKNVKYRKHMYLECIPIPEETGEMAPIFFKKAIDDSENEWVNNKKLIDLRKGGGVRKMIPRGFSYFAIDFGLQPGYAHVIENEDQFPQNFAHEVIGGILDLDRRRWRMNEKLTLEQQHTSTAELTHKFEPFNWMSDSRTADPE